MNAFEAYELYTALKRHFTSNYDYHKYHGKCRVKLSAFQARNDQWFFKFLSQQSNPRDFIVANFAVGADDFLYNSTAAEQTYREWKKRTESLFYLFTQDLNQLDDDYKSNFAIKGLPIITYRYIKRQINLETMVILIDILKLWDYYRANVADPLWEGWEIRLRKYVSFVDYDKKKYTDQIFARWPT